MGSIWVRDVSRGWMIVGCDSCWVLDDAVVVLVSARCYLRILVRDFVLLVTYEGPTYLFTALISPLHSADIDHT